MRSKIVAALLVSMLGTVASAQAEGIYFAGAAGASMTHASDFTLTSFPTNEAKYKTGYGANMSLGYDFAGPRIESEFGYKISDMKDLSLGGDSTPVTSDVKVASLMLNGFYDFKNKSIFTPYVGAGVGMLHVVLDLGQTDVLTNTKEVSDTVMGYQGIAGFSTSLSKSTSFDISYRYLGAAGDIKTTQAKFNYSSSNIFAGIRYTF